MINTILVKKKVIVSVISKAELVLPEAYLPALINNTKILCHSGLINIITFLSVFSYFFYYYYYFSKNFSEKQIRESRSCCLFHTSSAHNINFLLSAFF